MSFCDASGDLLCVASDHRTFNADQKALGKDDFRKIPHGMNGVSERMAVVWQDAVVCRQTWLFCLFTSGFELFEWYISFLLFYVDSTSLLMTKSMVVDILLLDRLMVKWIRACLSPSQVQTLQNFLTFIQERYDVLNM